MSSNDSFKSQIQQYICLNKSKNIKKTIIHICLNEFKSFLLKKNVAGIGLGNKVIKGTSTGQICIKVFVIKKISSSELDSKDLVPSLYKGIVTDVVEVGLIDFSTLNERVRPVTGGYSISANFSLFTGSYGGLVVDSSDTFYMLSCNHVLANKNILQIGTPITQPAFFDGGLPPLDIVANLSYFIPIIPSSPQNPVINFVDCAVAEPINRFIASPAITFIGIPTGLNTPFVGQIVKKVGRNTELTFGNVLSTNTTIQFTDSAGDTYLFLDQIVTSPMSVPGDSGAILLNSIDEALGLLMASSALISVYNNIFNVLNALNVNLVTSPI